MFPTSKFKKIPLPWRRKPLNRSEAWACLGINLLVFPGLGSIIAGRLSGFGQFILAGLGAVLAMIGAIEFLTTWYATLEMPGPGRSLWLAIGGVALFGIGWLWCLATSIQLLKETPKGPK